MVNGNEWEEKNNGILNRTGTGPAKGSRGVAKLCSLASSFSSSFFLFLFMDTNFGIPTRQGSSQSFFGGVSLFKRKVRLDTLYPV